MAELSARRARHDRRRQRGRETGLGLQRSWVCAALVFGLLVCGEALCQQQQLSQFDLPAQPLADSLRALGRQSHINILFPTSVASGLMAPALKAQLSAREALLRLLADTGITFEFLGNDTVVLSRSKSTAATAGAGSKSRPLLPEPAHSLENTSGEIEGVVVTARKRTELLQDVPMSVHVLSSQDILQQGADQFTDYYRLVPGVALQERGPGLNQVIVRGIPSLGGVGTAGVYIDDMPVTASEFQSDLKLSDIERIEVLRGPQGTLYGEGSMGGTVKVITAKPDLAVTGSRLAAQLSQSRGGESYAFDAMANIPLIYDRLAARAVAYSRETAGWLDNVALAQTNVNVEHTTGARLSVKALLSPGLTLNLMGLHQEQRIGGSQNADASLGDFVQFRPIDEPSYDRLSLFNANLSYDLPFANLYSSTSFFDRHQSFQRDLQVLAEQLQRTQAWIDTLLTTRTLTQEVRLTSPAENRLRYLVGVFFEHGESGDNEQVPTEPSVQPVKYFDTAGPSWVIQRAVFAELSYRVRENVTVTAGVRAFEEEQSFVSAQSVLGTAAPVFAGRSHASKQTPKVDIAYQMTDRTLLYALASEGVRSGGVNFSATLDRSVPLTYKPDSLWNYELGLKTLSSDRRWRLELAAFDIRWSDVQIALPVPSVPAVSYTDNADTAHSRGIEVDTTAHLTERVEVSLNGSYTDARLNRIVRQGLEIYPSGRLPNVPRFSAALTAAYTRPLPFSFASEGFVRLDAQYVGDSYNSPVNDAAGLQHAYGLANLRVGVRHEGWEVALSADNLLNTVAELSVDPGLSTPANRVVTRNPPRTIGVRVMWEN